MWVDRCSTRTTPSRRALRKATPHQDPCLTDNYLRYINSGTRLIKVAFTHRFRAQWRRSSTVFPSLWVLNCYSSLTAWLIPLVKVCADIDQSSRGCVLCTTHLFHQYHLGLERHQHHQLGSILLPWSSRLIFNFIRSKCRSRSGFVAQANIVNLKLWSHT